VVIHAVIRVNALVKLVTQVHTLFDAPAAQQVSPAIPYPTLFIYLPTLPTLIYMYLPKLRAVARKRSAPSLRLRYD
jgi:hypothetical protein